MYRLYRRPPEIEAVKLFLYQNMNYNDYKALNISQCENIHILIFLIFHIDDNLKNLFIQHFNI